MRARNFGYNSLLAVFGLCLILCVGCVELCQLRRATKVCVSLCKSGLSTAVSHSWAGMRVKGLAEVSYHRGL